MRGVFGASGNSYPVPQLLQGGLNLGFMVLPIYRAWVIFASLTVCGTTWFLIERTRLGATLRAATENARLVQAFGINVPLLVTVTYGAGAALAALAGVLAAPVIQVSPSMGSSLVIVVDPKHRVVELHDPRATGYVDETGAIEHPALTGFRYSVRELFDVLKRV